LESRSQEPAIDPAIVVTLVAGATSLAGATYTAIVAARIEEQRRERTKAEQLDELMSRYRDPLLRAAFDLQSRLYNIAEQGFLERYYANGDADAREYAGSNTLYVVAEYLGWIEILRREVRFLDLGDELSNRTAVDRVDDVRQTLLTDRYAPVLRIFNGQQRAIGELMARDADGGGDGKGRLECIGYAEFVARLQEPEFARWFARLSADIELMAGAPGRHLDRLVALQNVLVDLVDFLDPQHTRLPAADRRKLSRTTPSRALTDA
jgi:hypothetical protein